MAIVSSISRLWPIGTSSSSTVTEKESDSSSNATPSSDVPLDLKGATRNVLLPYISAIQWNTKEVATRPSAYVTLLHRAVFVPFAAGMRTITERLGGGGTGLKEHIGLMWNGLFSCLATYLLDAFSQVPGGGCSEEGRSQMLLDVQSLAVLAEADSDVR